MSIPFIDVARGDNHIAGVFGVGHNLIMVIYIIVFIIDALDSYDRHALSEVDINETDGMLTGNMTMNTYYLLGTDKVYSSPYIPDMQMGVDTIFGNME